MILLKKLFGTLMVMTMIVSNANARDRDCVDCGLKEAPGAPTSGNKNIDGITRALSQDGTSFNYYITTYCMTFTNVRNNFQFKKKIIEAMENSKFQAESYWQEAGCTPNKIGGTLSPIIHLAAENATERLPYLKVLHEYYTKSNGSKLWTTMINAKNSRGQTFLDYIMYLRDTNQIIDEQKNAMNELIVFACSTGGIFSTNKVSSCKTRI
jgi:hypothetical protein